jgi:hypothetical protein
MDAFCLAVRKKRRWRGVSLCDTGVRPGRLGRDGVDPAEPGSQPLVLITPDIVFVEGETKAGASVRPWSRGIV